jgi:hypothetical protein
VTNLNDPSGHVQRLERGAAERSTAQGVGQRSRRNWFHEALIETRVGGFRAKAARGAAGQRDEPEIARHWIAPELAGGGEAIDIGHIEIEQHGVGNDLTAERHRFGPARAIVDVHAFFDQCLRDDVPD